MSADHNSSSVALFQFQQLTATGAATEANRVAQHALVPEISVDAAQPTLHSKQDRHNDGVQHQLQFGVLQYSRICLSDSSSTPK